MECIIEIDGKQFVDTVKILPDALPSGKKILWRDLENGLVEISVDKHSARGGNPDPIIIKRFIEINEALFQLLGLWFGDGNKLRDGDWKAFGFSNTEITLHKLFLELTKDCLSINSGQFFCVLSTPPELQSQINEFESNVSKALNIPKENFWKTTINENRNMLHIDTRINSRLLSFSMMLLSQSLKSVVKTNKNFTSKFLQGVIASEANVHVRSNSGRLGEMMIAAEGEDKRNFLRNLLLSLDIQPNKDKTIEHQEGVLIHGLTNFRKIKEWNLCSLHPLKSANFERGLKGFKKEEFRNGESQQIILKLLSEGRLRREEIQKKINRGFRTTLLHGLVPLENRGFVRRIRKGRNIFWEITDEGKKILETGNPLGILRVKN